MFETSSAQESFCENYGAAGALLSLTGLFQLIYVMNDHWIGFVMMAIYVLAITSFVVLITKSRASFPLVLTTGILVFLMTVYTILSNFFSLILLILFIYTLIITVLLQTNGVDAYLKARRAAKDEELKKWDGIM
ncbi:MAG: hypothetical protein EOO88_56515 [Pedobacter sp.]|nr:MAG: hypothetical protein EOO88_56515 [Pedobacter sp.]